MCPVWVNRALKLGVVGHVLLGQGRPGFPKSRTVTRVLQRLPVEICCCMGRAIQLYSVIVFGCRSSSCYELSQPMKKSVAKCWRSVLGALVNGLLG
jgi:hypothetical protein